MLEAGTFDIKFSGTAIEDLKKLRQARRTKGKKQSDIGLTKKDKKQKEDSQADNSNKSDGSGGEKLDEEAGEKSEEEEAQKSDGEQREDEEDDEDDDDDSGNEKMSDTEFLDLVKTLRPTSPPYLRLIAAFEALPVSTVL